MNEQPGKSAVDHATESGGRERDDVRSSGSRAPTRVVDRQPGSDPSGGRGSYREQGESRGELATTATARPAPSGEARGPISEGERREGRERWNPYPFTAKQLAVLTEPLSMAEIEIRPDGLLYLPHTRVRVRLNAAFLPTGWRMVPIGEAVAGTREIIWRWQLQITGGWTADSTGHAAWIKGNDRYSYGDALETAKSDALVRCCKDLGIGLELWNRVFCDQFKSSYCMKVWRVKKSEYAWRRNDQEPYYDEGKPGRGSEDEYRRKPDVKEQAASHIASMKPDPEMPSSRGSYWNKRRDPVYAPQDDQQITEEDERIGEQQFANDGRED